MVKPMPEIIDTFNQGEPEWFSARLGSIGASSFSQVITSTGKLSTSAKKLMYKLAGESVCGEPEESYTNHHMERGIALEQEARDLYELVSGNTVKQIALCRSDIPNVHASPDGIMPDIKRGLEIKCPSMAVHVEYLIKGTLPTAYKAQVQGSMLVLGYDTYDFMSYYPGVKPLIITVKRDEDYIKKLEAALYKFVGELAGVVKKIS
jgi:putative phage-type endonuclease